jgi:hypothetical protein
MAGGRLVPIATGGVLVAVAAGGLWYLARPAPESAPEVHVPAAAEQQPAGPDAAAVRAALAAVSCVNGDAVTEPGGVVVLEGTAAAADLVEEAARQAGAVPGVSSVDNRLTVAPEPGCHAAAQALRLLDGGSGTPPQVTLSKPGGLYLDQDYLVVEVALPEGASGHVYVDVLTDAGSVYHLLPEPLAQANQLQAGGRVRVGVEAAERRDGVRHWQVSPPYGAAYLLATVTEHPLYEGLRPIEEPLDAYMPVLLAALQDSSSGAKAAQVQHLEFRPRS